MVLALELAGRVELDVLGIDHAGRLRGWSARSARGGCLNRPGCGGRSDSTERWSYASTKGVPG